MGSSSREKVLDAMGKKAKKRERRAMKKRRRGANKTTVARASGGAFLAGPFGHMLKGATGMAKRLGLYILADGNPKAPTWVIYDVTDGKRIMSYTPQSFTWRVGMNERGQVKCWPEALELAASRRNPLAPSPAGW